MKIEPTLDGRVKIALNNDGDYYLLTQLISDASDDDKIEKLASQFGESMLDEDWDEFVKPELISNFQTDILTVSNILKKMHDSGVKELYISKEESHAWYSTINQARLHLEENWNLSELTEDFSMENTNPELLEPCIKNNFYMHLQSLILEFVNW